MLARCRSFVTLTAQRCCCGVCAVAQTDLFDCAVAQKRYSASSWLRFMLHVKSNLTAQEASESGNLTATNGLERLLLVGTTSAMSCWPTDGPLPELAARRCLDQQEEQDLRISSVLQRTSHQLCSPALAHS